MEVESENIRFNVVNLFTCLVMVRGYALHLGAGRHGDLRELGILRILLFDDLAQTAIEQNNIGEYILGILGSTGDQSSRRWGRG